MDEFADSLDLYLKVAAKRPDDYTAWYTLASIAVKAGKTHEAIDYFSMAVYANRMFPVHSSLFALPDSVIERLPGITAITTETIKEEIGLDLSTAHYV